MYKRQVVCASCAQRADINYRIVTGQPLQVMEHFGASDAWSMHVLGKWPEEKQKQIADWLFSTENDANGKPKGIGLSLWRFNLGAGSTEQGDASQIGSPWMRTECFLQPDGSYVKVNRRGRKRLCAQEYFCQEAVQRAKVPKDPGKDRVFIPEESAGDE